MNDAIKGTKKNVPQLPADNAKSPIIPVFNLLNLHILLTAKIVYNIVVTVVEF